MITPEMETILTAGRWTKLVWMWEAIGKAIAVPYSVTLWGSNPDEADNDDCWIGEDYTTREAALEAYRALRKWPTDGLADHCPEWQYAMIDGPDVHGVQANPDERTAARWRRELGRADREWQSERAHQAGMAFGCDGHNDEMGY